MADLSRDSSRASSSGQGRYQCTQCQRTYTRVNHLARHVRSHLKERPFQCQICQKCFGRGDLLKRHIQSHQEAANNGKRPRLFGPQQNRVSAACQGCATAKAKCDDDKPCSRCQQLQIPCEFSGELTNNISTPIKETEISQLHNGDGSVANTPLDYDPTLISDHQLLTPSPLDSTNTQDSSQIMYSFLNGTAEPHTQLLPETQFSDFLCDVMVTPDTSVLENDGQSSWSAVNPRVWDVLDFNLDGDVQIGWPNISAHWPLPNTSHIYQTPNQAHHCHRQPGQEFTHHISQTATIHVISKRHAGVGVEAFQKSSLSRWLPAEKDNAQAHMTQLSVSSFVRPYPEQRVSSETLSTAACNRLLAIILSTCDADKGAAIASSFPPRELLDELVQSYIAQTLTMPTHFIHAPTFNPNKAEPALLGAVIAASAVLSDNKELQEFGFAIQEALCLVIMKQCEKSNALVRELWLMQTLLFYLEIGLWSGRKRKMEIAESQTHALFTMLRRSGQFQKCKKPAQTPYPQDAGGVLHKKWLDWIQQELRKRLSFCAFILDAQLSMAFLVSPQISYAEMMLPLPESRELWEARDAEQWRDIYLKKPSQAIEQPSPSLVGLLQQPLELSCLTNRYDLHLSAMITLYGMWGMIWEWTQLTNVLGARSGHRSATETLHQDLCQTLDNLQVVVGEVEEIQTPEVHLMLGLLTVYLNISLEKIQLFAGKEDLEEARRVLPELQEWAILPSARQAICGAGQVLRAARDFPARQLRNFQAIAVYHASLTCWTYGLISLRNSPREGGSQTSPLQTPANTIRLDGPDTEDFRRFIALGRGIPSVSSSQNTELLESIPISLSNIVAVLGVVQEILQKNAQSGKENILMPPLVENLLQLIIDLRKASICIINSLEL